MTVPEGSIAVDMICNSCGNKYVTRYYPKGTLRSEELDIVYNTEVGEYQLIGAFCQTCYLAEFVQSRGQTDKDASMSIYKLMEVKFPYFMRELLKYKVPAKYLSIVESKILDIQRILSETYERDLMGNLTGRVVLK